MIKQAALHTLVVTLCLDTPWLNAASAPDYALSASLEASPASLVLSAHAPQGHHFNVKAPAYAADGAGSAPVKPTELTPQSVRFEIKAPKPGTYSTQIYLCDDALTFCEKKTETYSFAPGTPGSVKSAPDHSEAVTTPSSNPTSNQTDRAFQTARDEHRPMMVDFYGVWCPPCNMLNEKVFSTAAFKRAIQGFIEVKIDVDTPEAWAYTSRYKIAGYPTVLFLTPDGEEISRILGYRPLAQFLKTLKDAYKMRDPSTLSQLAARALKGDRSSSDQLGLIELGRGNYKEASQYLEKTTHYREKLYDAEIALASEQASKDGSPATDARLADLRKKAIAEFPNSPDSIERRSDLAEQLAAQGKKEQSQGVYLGAIDSAKEIIAHHAGSLAHYDSSVADIWEQIADMYRALGRPDDEKASYKTAATEFRKELITPTDRGVNLELAFSLWKSGDEAQAREIYARMQKAYPSDFTFFNNQARMELALGKLDAALDLSTKAVGLAYGSNRLEASLVLAKILKAQKKIPEARKAIETALESPEAKMASPVSSDPHVRFYRSRQRLEDYKKKELS